MFCQSFFVVMILRMGKMQSGTKNKKNIKLLIDMKKNTKFAS